MAARIILVKTGSTFPSIKASQGDFEDWFLRALDGCDVQLIDATTLPHWPELLGNERIIITGSPAMVTDHAHWSEQLADWLKHKAHGKVPILGVCYGHQLLAHALGGAVDWHPQGRESGTVSIQLTGAGQQDPLLGTLPSTFTAQVTHAQRVSRLPPDAIVLAGNDFETHHAFRLGDTTWGVQFHPEFDADIMKAYVHAIADGAASEPVSTQHISPATADLALLRHFALGM